MIFLFFNSFFILGQGLNIKVEYKKNRLSKSFTKEKNKNLGSSKLSKFSKIEDEITKAQALLVFDLWIKGKEALFKLRPFLAENNNSFIKMSAGPEAMGEYYNNENQILRKVNTYGEDFLISKPKFNWVLKSEKKIIGDYVCNKAVLVEEVKTRRGIKKNIITAWYTPQIKAPFGPIGYSGLPGLIMELRRKNIKYYITKININPKEEVVFKKPTKGRKVTQTEFYDIGIRLMSGFRKNKGF